MFDWLFNSLDDEKELKKYGLDENECKVLKQDNYDYWNFDEEDLEEDDYYVEDDDVESSLDLKTSSEKTSWENFYDEDDDEE
jgi:hypothetical protein